MNAVEQLLFWGIIVLLIVASLTRMSDWLWFLNQFFSGLVFCFSSRSHAGHFAIPKSKHHQMMFDMDPQARGHKPSKSCIFPRPRRDV